MVTADELVVSCVLPALTCWVELCTDHTCIRALGTVGSTWGACILYQPSTCIQMLAGNVFTIIIQLETKCSKYKTFH